MNHPRHPDTKLSGSVPNRRYLVAAAILIAGSLYPASIVTGCVPPANRLGGVDLVVVGIALFAAALAVSPSLVASVRRVKTPAFEVELAQVREQQRAQQARIAQIDELLPLLLPRSQFQHLKNLLTLNTAGYRGGQSLQTELRQLASSGLIRRRPGMQIDALRSDFSFDLADYVEITPLGRYWGDRYANSQTVVAQDDED